MRKIKKLSLLLAMLMTISLPLSACNGLLASTANSSTSQSSSISSSKESSESSLNSIESSDEASSIFESSSSDESTSLSSIEESSSSIHSSEADSSDNFEESSSEESSENEGSDLFSSTEDSSIEDSSEESSFEEISSSESSEDSPTEESSESDSSDTFSSIEDSSNEDSSMEDSSNESSEDEPNPQHAIVDMAYALSRGETLAGSYTLTGTVTAVDNGSKLNVTIEIEGREAYPIYCYNLQGATATIELGDVITVYGTLKNYKGTIEFDSGRLTDHESNMPSTENDPYVNVSSAEFYASYTPAVSNEDAYYRSLHGFMSGDLKTPDQAPILSSYQPKDGSKFVRNSTMLFDESGMEYTVVDCYGNEAFKVYRNGAYITLEEVAAFVYAFGTYPANYTTSKNTSPSSSIWGEYLRLNHTAFSGSTSKYPYEPELPNITGCGGKLNYFEMDIGTTGTDCDPSYDITIYNDGRTITRGAARIVYGKNDLNKDGIYGPGEHYVFYTYNHYNDFQEYLNYAGGWGEMFGNITGGGTLSSKYDYAPTSYVEVSLAPITSYMSVPLSSFYNNYYNRKFAFNLA